VSRDECPFKTGPNALGLGTREASGSTHQVRQKEAEMRRLLSMGVLGAIILAGVVAGSSGVAVAQTGGGSLRFTEVFAGRDPDGTIVATGVITGIGHATAVGDVDIWTFPGKGTITFTRAVTSYTEQFDPATCTTTFSGVESFRLSGGTGQLRGLTIEGTFTDRGVFIADRVDGGCSPDSGTVFVVARGQGQAE
jgi:hypothetical protein